MTASTEILIEDEASQLFALLDGEGRKRLVLVATEQSFPAGAVVMKEGEEGDTFYMILTGHARVSSGSTHRADIEGGAIVGEIAVLLGRPRTATVIAETAISTLRFQGSEVMEILRDYPEAMEALENLARSRSSVTP